MNISRRHLSNAAITTCSLVILAGSSLAAQGLQPNDYLVSFDAGAAPSSRAAAAARHGAVVRFNYGIIDAVAITVPNDNALRGLAQEPGVRRITPDYPVFATENPNARKGKPPSGGTDGTAESPQVVPPGVVRVGALADSSTGAGVGVAVVDTGIDYNHPDLAPIGGGVNTVSNLKTCLDDNGHGTHVSGTIAALDNTIGVVGVAPAVTLYCVKVLNSQGSGSWSTIIAGLDWVYSFNGGDTPASPLPIGVINMSLGGSGDDSDSDLKDAIRRLHDQGVVTVVAAGNDPSLDISQQVPAAYSRDNLVLTVASTTAVNGSASSGCPVIPADTASYFTSDGLYVTISAPGEEREDVTRRGNFCYLNSVGVLSLKLGGGTTRMSGTSMASPHVAGIVARLLQDLNLYGIPSPVIGSDTTNGIIDYFTLGSGGADRQGVAPLASPTSSYSYDGRLEGIAIVNPTHP